MMRWWPGRLWTEAGRLRAVRPVAEPGTVSAAPMAAEVEAPEETVRAMAEQRDRPLLWRQCSRRQRAGRRGEGCGEYQLGKH